MGLKVITPEEKVNYKPDLNTYKRAMLRFCEERNLLESKMTPAEWYRADKDSLIKMLYLEVKLIRCGRRELRGEIRSRAEAQDWMDTIFFMEDMFSALTPRELLRMFPVTKHFDGARWETKDYFYTMDKITALEIDKPLRERRGFLNCFMIIRIQT